MAATLENILSSIPLSNGVHKNPTEGACAMECVAYLQGESYTDHPECASPVIAAFTALSNDAMKPEQRQLLAPRIPRILGSHATPETEVRRLCFLADYAARSYAATALRLANLDEFSEPLTALPPYTDIAQTADFLAAIAAVDAAIDQRFAGWETVPRIVKKCRALLQCLRMVFADIESAAKVLHSDKTAKEIFRLLIAKSVGAASTSFHVFINVQGFTHLADRIAVLDGLLDIGNAGITDEDAERLVSRAQLLALFTAEALLKAETPDPDAAPSPPST